MIRVARIAMISVAVFLVAWVIKEVMFQGDAARADELLQKIRMSGTSATI